jgi:hypothetical protein
VFGPPPVIEYVSRRLRRHLKEREASRCRGIWLAGREPKEALFYLYCGTTVVMLIWISNISRVVAFVDGCLKQPTLEGVLP